MKVIFFLLPVLFFSQALPDVWSQSYCTYDIAELHRPGEYSLGFAIDNFTLYSDTNDSTAYDTRRYDIFAKLGVFRDAEFEIKFSSPTAGVIACKYKCYAGVIDAAVKIGFGYMKGTRIGFITDYVFDFYPTLIFSKRIFENIRVYYAPKIIYSIHPRDRQEHSTREPRHIFQYGHGIGLSFGNNFTIMPEGNWIFGNNEGTKYTVNQFGVGVNLRIH